MPQTAEKQSKSLKSKELYEKACAVMPGGVNSPVRSFNAVNSTPLFISKANGAYIWDVDQNKYIDFVNSWGALICGHANPKVISKVEEAIKNGTSFGAPHENEIKLAKLIIQNMPSIEKLRLVSSGTEAVMTAIRLARAYTKRNKIIKFSGCYHGHSDSVLSMSGSGIATFGLPTSPGVTKNTANDTITIPYNDIFSTEIAINKYPKEIAGVIVEPVVGNAGVIKPESGFLEALRALTTKHGALLIFDEVITGFRLSLGGAQKIFNINPDITILGKIIGGGMPIGAVGGKKEIIDLLAPSGPVYQAGTLSGNPISVACGIATLEQLNEEIYQSLEETNSYLCNSILSIADEINLDITVTYIGSLFSIFFTKTDVKNFEDAKSSDTEKYSKFFNHMLIEGIYLAPSQFEANFISTAHTKEDMNKTINSFKKAIETCR